MYSLAHFLSHLRRSQIGLVLDVGANTGQFASELFNAGFPGRVISFELLSVAHAALEKAAQDNSNWEVAPRCALGAEAGNAVINIAGNSYSSSLRPMLKGHLAAAPQSAYVGAEATPIDTLANYLERRFSGSAPRFALKIDTQGFEREVLDGLGAHVEQCAAVLLKMPLDALYGGAADLPTLFTRLVESGLRCVGLSPGHKHLWTRDAIEVDGFFIRDFSAAEQTFPLFTSVSPRLSGEALLQQREVVSSWRAAGFDPISVNGPREIAQLAALDLGIGIEPAPEDGKPFIGDILAAIRKRGSARAGIINADCKMLGYPDLALTLDAALGNGVLFAERIEIRDGCSPILGDCGGFDAFFFDTNVLGQIDDQYFRIGETWWDYWFPLQLAVSGAVLGNIALPVILHRPHEFRWSQEQWLGHGRHLWGMMKACSEQNALPPSFSFDGVRHLDEPDSQQIAELGSACFEWLRTRRLPREVTFLPNGMESVEALLRTTYCALGELAATRNELAATRNELAATRNELAAVYASTSWRITAPLRRALHYVK